MGVPSNMHSVGIWPFDDLVQKAVVEHAIEASKPDGTKGKEYYTNDKPRPMVTSTADRKLSLSYDQVGRLLRNAGLSKPVLDWAWAQGAQETSGYTYTPAMADNNLSGIMWLNKPYQKNATKGRPMPDNKGHFYAHFKTFQDWANDFVRILKLNLHKAGSPATATGPEDYVHRLKANGYFTGPELIYLRNLIYYLAKLPGAQASLKSDIDKTSADITKQNDAAKKYQASTSWLKNHPLATGALATLLVIVGIRAIAK